MQLKKAELGVGYQAIPGGAAHVSCKALDQSDLTLTGEAKLKNWLLGTTVVTSAAIVFETVSDANVSWRQQLSSAGTKCAIEETRRAAGTRGGKLLSLKRLAFARVGPQSAAYRLVFTLGPQGPPLVTDLVALQLSRAQAFFTITSLLATAPTKTEEVRLARLVAARMARAMRGA